MYPQDARARYRERLYAAYESTHLAHRGASNAGATAHLRTHILPRLPRDRSVRILDLGCGRGDLMAFLAEIGYRDVQGVDISDSIAVARERGLRAVQADASAYLREHPGQLDAIVMLDVLEHFGRDEVLPLLDLAFDALAPGGRIVIQTSNADGPFFGHYLYGDLTHETSFTARSIVQVLSASQFTTIRVYPVRPAVHGPASLVRWVAWQIAGALMIAYLAAETGVFRGYVLSQNLVAVGVRGR